MNLPQLHQDKANHFIYGLVIYGLSALICDPFPSMFIVMSVAFFKEFIDTYSDSSDFSFGDFFATTIGGLTALLLMYETTRL